MSVFNEENYLSAAIESILDQTYSNFEFIIINDYSTDKSLDICEQYKNKDPRIRIYSKITEPKHLAASRNIGISIAKGAYIILQDADDVSRNDRIEKQLTYALQNHRNRVVGCVVNRIEAGRSRVLKLPETHIDIVKGFERFYNRTTIVSGTILAPKQVLMNFPYRVIFKYMQDWDHMLRMYESRQIEFYNCQEPLYNYYIREKGVTFNPEWLDYNIFIRNCQIRRKNGLREFDTLIKFHEYLTKHPIERIKWNGFKKMISLKLKIGRIKTDVPPPGT
jgi:glycosyltransferase involved in cell wall biosynthesis